MKFHRRQWRRSRMAKVIFYILFWIVTRMCVQWRLTVHVPHRDKNKLTIDDWRLFYLRAIIAVHCLFDQIAFSMFDHFFFVLRFTPMYAFLLFFHATWLTRLSSGPMWPLFSDLERNICRKNYWTNLLYVNNVFYSTEPVRKADLL